MKLKKTIMCKEINTISILCYAFIFSLIFSLNVSAQTKTLKGLVTDQETNLPIPGVTILIKGTKRGAVTDFDGNYSLNIVGDNPILEFSFLGYETKTITYKNQTVLNVSLVAALNALDEIVVVGYGTAKKSDLTGAVSSVKGTSIEKGAPVSFQNALAGRVSGVQITRTDNGPGGGVNVLIRGGSSLTSGNQPLYVIDGFPIVPDDDPQTNPLADISPTQIESIEILKDASATAIFGAQGANGVILVTTKLGAEGKPSININATFGLSELSNYINTLSPEEFPNLIIERQRLFNYLNTDGQQGSIDYWQDIIDNGVKGKNWLKEITRAAQTKDVNVSFSGGKDGLRYAVSGNFLNQEGIILGSKFDRLNFNINLEQKLNDRLKVGISSKMSLSENTGILNSWQENSIIKKAVQSNPYIDEDFDVSQVDVQQENEQWNNENIVEYINSVDNEFTTSRIISNIFLEYNLTESLKFYTSYGFNRYYKDQHSFLPQNTRQGLNVGGEADIRKQNSLNQVFQARLNYNKRIKKHNINLTGVFESRNDERMDFRSVIQQFEDDSRGVYDLSSASNILQPTNIYQGFSLMSFLGRASYSFGGKYLLTASLRADGSSRFGSDNKWGYFPSLALGWVASKEKFIKDLNTFSLLKFRLSYGVTGNNQIPNYSSLAALQTERYVFDNTLYAGMVPGRIANPDLRWEKTAQYNVGIDMGFFKNRLSIIAEAYYKKTTDLLLDLQIPSTSGFNTALKNIGSISNKGFELTINSVNINKNDFRWNSAFTFSTNRSEILNLGENQEIYFTRNFANNIVNDVLVRVGEQIGIYYGYIEDEVLNSENEIANSPESDVLENIVGQVKLYDVNGDGVITPADKVPLAKTVPDFIGGLNNEFTYKNFDLSFMLRWSYGNDVINGNVTFLDRVGQGNWNTLHSMVDHIYTPINPSGTIHGNVPDTYSNLMRSNYVEDGSFLKMDFITIGYRLPESILKKYAINNFRIFARVDNPFMFTRYSWFDPEVSTGFGTVAKVGPGADVGTYPRSTTYNIGLSIGL